MIDGKVYHFGACGLANGLAILADEETRSYWDHITGECFLGPLKGHKLDTWPIQLTTAEAALAECPKAELSLSYYRSAGAFFLSKVMGDMLHGKGFVPPFFRTTMHAEIDDRLPKLENGLGVIVGKEARYYPMRQIPQEGIEVDWDGRFLVIRKGKLDRIPVARWKDSKEKPMQLLARWYGFSFTYPHCKVWKPEDKD